MSEKMSVFETLSAIDVSTYIEKKGQFSYLSWADAVTALLKAYPEATWRVVSDVNGLPYITAPNGCFVTVEVTVEGISRTQVHPVLNFRNQAIADPSPFEINTSIQRALAKAIGLHGLGLHIYRGEDINPDAVNKEKIDTKPVNQAHVQSAYEAFKEEIDKDEGADIDRIHAGWSRLTNDEQIACADLFGSLKPEGSKKMYKNILKSFLAMKKIGDEWVD